MENEKRPLIKSKPKNRKKMWTGVGLLLSCTAIITSFGVGAYFIVRESQKDNEIVNSNLIIDNDFGNFLFSILRSNYSPSKNVTINGLNSNAQFNHIKNVLINRGFKDVKAIQSITYSPVDGNSKEVKVKVTFKKGTNIKFFKNNFFELDKDDKLSIVTIKPLSFNLAIRIIDGAQIVNVLKEYVKNKSTLDEINELGNINGLISRLTKEMKLNDGDLITSISFRLVDNNKNVKPTIAFNNYVEIDKKTAASNFSLLSDKMSITTKISIPANIYINITSDLKINYGELSKAINEWSKTHSISDIAKTLNNKENLMAFFARYNKIIGNRTPLKEVASVQVKVNSNNTSEIQFIIIFNNKKYAYFLSNDFYVFQDNTLIGLTDSGKLQNTLDLSSYNITKIANEACYNSTNLQNIILPNTLVEIGERAFKNCVVLNNVVIPRAVVEIKNEAFNNCNLLTDVRIESGSELRVIGQNAFNNNQTIDLTPCNYIGKRDYFIISNNNPDAEFISSRVSINEFNLSTITSQNINDRGILNIPADKDAVMGSVPEKFKSRIKGITFENNDKNPSQILFIGNSAFKGCNYITTKIDIPDSVLYIDDEAFKDCSGLSSFSFTPTTQIQEFGAGVFENCTSFINFTIPATVTAISDRMFKGCVNLSKINFVNRNKITSFGAESFMNITNAVFSFGVNTTGSNTNYPTNLSYIGPSAFENSNIPQFEIPSNVLKLNDRTFYNSKLRDITFANNSRLSTIGNDVFNSSEIVRIDLPNTLKTIGDRSFMNTKSLSNIKLSNATSLSTIGVSCFESSVFAQIVLPNSVTTLGTRAFAKSNIKSFSLPPKLKELSDELFNQCKLLTSVVTTEATQLTTIGNNTFAGCVTMSEFIIPTTVTTIKSGAFKNCNKLASFTTTGSQLVTIENDAFDTCGSLSSIELPTTLTTIGNNAFRLTGLTSISIPNTVTSIGSQAFANCLTLATLTIDTASSSLTSLGDYAFTNTQLSTVTLPNNLTNLGIGIFKNCTSLTSATLYAGTTIKTIPESLFQGCSKLTSFTIPNSINTIGASSFLGTGLITITIPDSVIQIQNSAFESCTSLTSVTINKTASNLTFFGNNSFKSTNITSITIPNSLKEISSNAFNGCVELTKWDIDLNATKLSIIGDGAFDGCIKLYSSLEIELPNTLNKIGDNAFRNCSFNWISFGTNSSLRIIGNSAFDSCTKLGSNSAHINDSIVLPASVESIGSLAFNGCSTLTKVSFGVNSLLTKVAPDAFKGCGSEAIINFANCTYLSPNVANDVKTISSVQVILPSSKQQ